MRSIGVINQSLSNYVDEQVSRISLEMQDLEQQQDSIHKQQQDLDRAITLAKARTYLVIERANLNANYSFSSLLSTVDKVYELVSSVYETGYDHQQEVWVNLQKSFEIVRHKVQQRAPDTGVAIDNLVSQLW
jgi:hypothetical protein